MTARPRTTRKPRQLTHVAPDGSVRMVDVGAKPATRRRAVAQAVVKMSPAALEALRRGTVSKGDALTTAQIAGIAAAKRTSELIPLCHPLALTHVSVALEPHGRGEVRIRCETACTGTTGVEMEALTGAAVAALTLYDMCKALDRAMTISSVRLLEKKRRPLRRFQTRPAALSDRGIWRVALLVLSDKAAAGQREDECIAAMRDALPPGFNVVLERILPDEQTLIERALIELSDGNLADCVLTSGGTGLGPRDVTPQATRAIARYEVPGLAEAMRAGSIAHVPTAMLSRAIAAVRGTTLIVNLPGSPRGARETLSLIAGVLPHALSVLTGVLNEHPRGQVH